MCADKRPALIIKTVQVCSQTITNRGAASDNVTPDMCGVSELRKWDSHSLSGRSFQTNNIYVVMEGKVGLVITKQHPRGANKYFKK